MYDSDDERAYKNEKVPDPRSSEYFNDEVDEFHAKRDQVFLLLSPIISDMLVFMIQYLYIFNF